MVVEERATEPRVQHRMVDLFMNGSSEDHRPALDVDVDGAMADHDFDVAMRIVSNRDPRCL